MTAAKLITVLPLIFLTKLAAEFLILSGHHESLSEGTFSAAWEKPRVE